MKDTLRNLQHSDQVLAALENKNGCEIFLVGKDNVRSKSESLWILSPLIRSIIGSLGNTGDNNIILPDFTSAEIKSSLDIIEGAKDAESLVFFNSTIKHLLESLEINLMNTKTFDINTDNWGEIENNNSKNLPSNELQELQELLLEDNQCFDFSDDEEDTEKDNITVDELAPGINIKVEDIEVTEDAIEGDREEIEILLLKDQDISDSDDDSDDDSDEMITTSLYDDKLIMEVSKGLDLLSKRRKEDTNEDISEDEEGDEDERVNNVTETAIEASLDSCDLQQQRLQKVETESSDEKETKATNSELKNLHQAKMKEVEKLLIKDSGRWKCRECGKTCLQRASLLHHAEIHVSGLFYPCNHCSKTFNTRNKLYTHRYAEHKDKVKKHRK